MYWLTIDPGISGTGFAVFHNKILKRYGSVYPDRNLDNWERRTSSILLKLMEEIHMAEAPQHVYIEWPSQFTGKRGLAAANSNDILKLTCLIGRLAQYYIGIGTPTVMLVPVNRWKGNLPKEVVVERIKKFFSIRGVASHAADAVGIGQYVLTKALVSKK